MAYGDSSAVENARLLVRTLTSVTDFTGRSRRTEVIYYWIAAALVFVMLGFLGMMLLPFRASVTFSTFLRLLLVIPMFALFARRLHDQGRSAWWSILLPIQVVLSIPPIVTVLSGDVYETVAQVRSPLAVVSQLLGLAIFVLCLLPGTDGRNQYGPDPRLEED